MFTLHFSPSASKDDSWISEKGRRLPEDPVYCTLFSLFSVLCYASGSLFLAIDVMAATNA